MKSSKIYNGGFLLRV